jgi:hypothetical protein
VPATGGHLTAAAFIFAGPTLGPFDTVRITSQRDEVTAWRWATRDSARALLHPAVAARIAGPPELPGGAVYPRSSPMALAQACAHVETRAPSCVFTDQGFSLARGGLLRLLPGDVRTAPDTA